MTALVLDTRALEVIADTRADVRAARRMRDLLASAARMGIPVRVPTAVLAEAHRGTAADAAIDHVLGRGARPIATGDPEDLRSLARDNANVKIQSLS